VQILGGFAGRRIVECRAMQPQQFTLAAQTQLWMVRLDQGPLDFRRTGQTFF
jgi:hypothetical protein